MEKYIEKALKNINNTYNRDKKGKAFIRHLIGAFLPINPMNLLIATEYNDETKNIKCCVLHKKIVSVGDLTELSLYKTRMSFKIASEDDTKKRKSLESEFIKTITSLQKKYNIDEGENIMDTRKIYFSETSDKYISAPAIIALYRFYERQVLSGDTYLTNIAKRRYEWRNYDKEKESTAGTVQRPTTSGLFDGQEDVLNQLKNKKN